MTQEAITFLLLSVPLTNSFVYPKLIFPIKQTR